MRLLSVLVWIQFFLRAFFSLLCIQLPTCPFVEDDLIRVDLPLQISHLNLAYLVHFQIPEALLAHLRIECTD